MPANSLMFVSIIALSYFGLIQQTNAHSWLTCTDYIDKNSDTYSIERCRGFPRAANRYLGRDVEFGAESGYSHEPTEDQPCRMRRNDHAHYDNEYPMAVYYQGQQVVLAHPMKLHGGDADCTNPFIPDTGSWIYRGLVNQQSDPSLSDFMKHMVFDLSKSPLNDEALSRTYPKPGFQNAPRFCLNQDKALGTYSFNVPLDLRPGRYTFYWLWAFNNMGDLHSTCFEVQIVRTQRERNMKLWKSGYKNLSTPCGGMTSNPEIRGSCFNSLGYDLNGHSDDEDKDGDGASELVLNNLLLFLCIFTKLIILQ